MGVRMPPTVVVLVMFARLLALLLLLAAAAAPLPAPVPLDPSAATVRFDGIGGDSGGGGGTRLLLDYYRYAPGAYFTCINWVTEV
jgi:hypothetical protein